MESVVQVKRHHARLPPVVPPPVTRSRHSQDQHNTRDPVPHATTRLWDQQDQMYTNEVKTNYPLSKSNTIYSSYGNKHSYFVHKAIPSNSTRIREMHQPEMHNVSAHHYSRRSPLSPTEVNSNRSLYENGFWNRTTRPVRLSRTKKRPRRDEVQATPVDLNEIYYPSENIQGMSDEQFRIHYVPTRSFKFHHSANTSSISPTGDNRGIRRPALRPVDYSGSANPSPEYVNCPYQKDFMTDNYSPSVVSNTYIGLHSQYQNPYKVTALRDDENKNINDVPRSEKLSKLHKQLTLMTHLPSNQYQNSENLSTYIHPESVNLHSQFSVSQMDDDQSYVGTQDDIYDEPEFSALCSSPNICGVPLLDESGLTSGNPMKWQASSRDNSWRPVVIRPVTSSTLRTRGDGSEHGFIKHTDNNNIENSLYENIYQESANLNRKYEGSPVLLNSHSGETFRGQFYSSCVSPTITEKEVDASGPNLKKKSFSQSLLNLSVRLGIRSTEKTKASEIDTVNHYEDSRIFVHSNARRFSEINISEMCGRTPRSFTDRASPRYLQSHPQSINGRFRYQTSLQGNDSSHPSVTKHFKKQRSTSLGNRQLSYVNNQSREHLPYADRRMHPPSQYDIKPNEDKSHLVHNFPCAAETRQKRINRITGNENPPPVVYKQSKKSNKFRRSPTITESAPLVNCLNNQSCFNSPEKLVKVAIKPPIMSKQRALQKIEVRRSSMPTIENALKLKISESPVLESDLNSSETIQFQRDDSNWCKKVNDTLNVSTSCKSVAETSCPILTKNSPSSMYTQTDSSNDFKSSKSHLSPVKTAYRKLSAPASSNFGIQSCQEQYPKRSSSKINFESGTSSSSVSCFVTTTDQNYPLSPKILPYRASNSSESFKYFNSITNTFKDKLIERFSPEFSNTSNSSKDIPFPNPIPSHESNCGYSRHPVNSNKLTNGNRLSEIQSKHPCSSDDQSHDYNTSKNSMSRKSSFSDQKCTTQAESSRSPENRYVPKEIDSHYILSEGGHYSFDEEDVMCSDVHCDGKCTNNIHNFSRRRSNSLSVNYSSDCSSTDLHNLSELEDQSVIEKPKISSLTNFKSAMPLESKYKRKQNKFIHSKAAKQSSIFYLVNNSDVESTVKPDKNLNKDESIYNSNSILTERNANDSCDDTGSLHCGDSTFYVNNRELTLASSKNADGKRVHKDRKPPSRADKSGESNAPTMKTPKNEYNKNGYKLSSYIPHKLFNGCSSPVSTSVSNSDIDCRSPDGSDKLSKSRSSLVIDSRKSSNTDIRPPTKHTDSFVLPAKNKSTSSATNNSEMSNKKTRTVRKSSVIKSLSKIHLESSAPRASVSTTSSKDFSEDYNSSDNSGIKLKKYFSKTAQGLLLKVKERLNISTVNIGSSTSNSNSSLAKSEVSSHTHSDDASVLINNNADNKGGRTESYSFESDDQQTKLRSSKTKGKPSRPVFRTSSLSSRKHLSSISSSTLTWRRKVAKLYMKAGIGEGEESDSLTYVGFDKCDGYLNSDASAGHPSSGSYEDLPHILITPARKTGRNSKPTEAGKHDNKGGRKDSKVKARNKRISRKRKFL